LLRPSASPASAARPTPMRFIRRLSTLQQLLGTLKSEVDIQTREI
jgi:hypothetical protein